MLYPSNSRLISNLKNGQSLWQENRALCNFCSKDAGNWGHKVQPFNITMKHLSRLVSWQADLLLIYAINAWSGRNWQSYRSLGMKLLVSFSVYLYCSSLVFSSCNTAPTTATLHMLKGNDLLWMIDRYKTSQVARCKLLSDLITYCNKILLPCRLHSF